MVVIIDVKPATSFITFATTTPEPSESITVLTVLVLFAIHFSASLSLTKAPSVSSPAFWPSRSKSSSVPVSPERSLNLL